MGAGHLPPRPSYPKKGPSPVAKKKIAKKSAAKIAHTKKLANKASEKLAATVKTSSSVVAKCPSCGCSVSIDDCSASDSVECPECFSDLCICKKGAKVKLSLEHFDAHDDFPQCD